MSRTDRVRLELFDVVGRRVAATAFGTLPAGAQTLQWRPGGLGTGVYLLRVHTEWGTEASKRLVVIR